MKPTPSNINAIENFHDIEEILKHWSQDSKIDNVDLADESLRIPSLHHKYISVLNYNKKTLLKLKQSLKKLKKLKINYFNGLLTKEELESLGWTSFKLKIHKTELNLYLEADKDIQDVETKIESIENIIEVVYSIIQTLNGRGYLIKNAIDWIKFQNGI